MCVCICPVGLRILDPLCKIAYEIEALGMVIMCCDEWHRTDGSMLEPLRSGVNLEQLRIRTSRALAQL